MTFLWGTATSAHQVEGWNEHNDWWEWEQRFHRSLAACDFAKRFEDDLDLARALGTNSFRFSIEWSRVEPREGERDEQAALYYERLLRACRERGLEPMVTLHHFTLPRWTAARGGWLDPGTVDAFERFVAWVQERYGSLARLWITINEPSVLAGAGYLSGIFPPGKLGRLDLANRCERGLALAHDRALAILKKDPGARVGIAQNMIAWKRDAWDPLGIRRRVADRYNWGFLDAVSGFDFVGVNYYMGLGVGILDLLRFSGILPKRQGPGRSDLGWPIDPNGFERVLIEAHRRYGKPVIVTENGIADATDTLRPAYLAEHLEALERARQAGAAIEGYYHWSLVDNFEWHEGYAPRFGLYEVDYATQARRARRSGEVYREFIGRGKLEKRG